MHNLRIHLLFFLSRIAPARALRSFLPLCLLSLLVAGLALFIFTRSLQQVPLPAASSELSALRVWLDADALQIPGQPGIYLQPANAAHLIIGFDPVRSRSEEIDLCTQRSLAAADPSRILPLVIARLDQLPAQAQLRNAMLLPAADNTFPPLPLLSLQGRVNSDLRDLNWQLAAGDWYFVSDQMAQDGKQGGMQPLRAYRQAWLLWGSLPHAAGTARAFQFALSFDSRAHTCARGPGQGSQLRVRFYQAPTARVDEQALRAVHLLPQNSAVGGMPPLWLKPGRHLLPAAKALPSEEQALMAQLLEHGLLRIRPGAEQQIMLDLAAQDILPALELGQIPAAWQDLQKRLEANASGAVKQHALYARLLRRLYHKADGAALRREIALFNQSPADSRIRWRDGQLKWDRSRPTGPARPDMQVYSSDGVLLYAAGKAQAPHLGLASWFSAQALPAALARRVPAAQAANPWHLSIDSRWQSKAAMLLDCRLQQVAQTSAHDCSALPAPTTPQAAGKGGSLVLLDAENGDILAAAVSGVHKLPPWQHDAGSAFQPGSVWKLVSALGLEMRAQHDPALQKLLAGSSLAQLQRQGTEQGFHPYAACYPAPCSKATHQVPNFHHHLPANYARGGVFGLQQALGASINTWFAWQGEMQDASLRPLSDGAARIRRPALIDARDFHTGALAQLRPMHAAAHLLGLQQELDLMYPGAQQRDGRDFLSGSALHLEHVEDRHQARLQALGQRLQVTPLQMALLAAAIGQGRVPAPRLLQPSVPSGMATTAGPQAANNLPLPLERIRAGMRDCVQNGTAKQAFAAPALAGIRAHLLGKTGTAERGGEGLNNAWFVAYLPAHSLPGQCRALAMAALIQDTALTGGAQAAPMVAQFLHLLQQGQLRMPACS